MKNKQKQQNKTKDCGSKNCGGKNCKGQENHSYEHGGNND